MTTSVVATVPFWRELLERAGRQAAQAAIPVIAAIGTAQGGVDARAIAIVVLTAVAVTLLKGLAGITLAVGESIGWELLDRAVPAMAGTMLGFVPVDAANILDIDWQRAGVAAVCAGVLAVLSYFVTPPALTSK